MYVIKVNGSALSGREGLLAGGGVASLRLDPEDTFVVPEDLQRIAGLREVKDIPAIFGQFAWLGGVIVAGRQ